MKNKSFLVLLIFYISYLWFNRFSFSVLPTYLLSQNINLSQMIISLILGFTGQLTMLLTIKKLHAKRSWRLALFFVAISILLLISIKSIWQFYLAYFLNGFSFFFFWVFYNVAYFEQTSQEKRGQASALMFNVPALLAILAPPLAGLIISLNINLLWAFSGLFFLLSLYLANFQQDFELSFNPNTNLKEIKSTRIFILIEGIWEALVFGVIPVYTLYFIKTPIGYGAFLSYLAVVSVLANFTIGHMTDKLQKRALFLYPLTISLSIATLLFFFMPTVITTWIILTSIVNFLLPIFWNVSTNLVVDSHRDLRKAMPAREIMLALGRMAGLSLVFVSFVLEPTPHFIFLILGSVFLLYPALLWYNTKVSKNYSYL